MPSNERIAIIGSGIAGLSAAWLLCKDHQITLYEKASKAGMGIYSVKVPNCNKTVDIPLRVFTPAYYPHLLELYARAGVVTEKTNHSAAYADENNRLFFHYGNLLLGGKSLSFPKHLSPNLLRLHVTTFQTLHANKDNPDLCQLNFDEFLTQTDLCNDFTKRILLPALATVCTCDYQDVLNYPADIIIKYLTCGVMEDGLLRAVDGVDDVITKLLDPSVNLKTNIVIHKIERSENGVEIHTNDNTESYDRIIIATQPHHAALLLGDSQQSSLLAQVPITQSRMIVHTDANLLPPSLLPLAPVTYYLEEDASRPEAAVHLNKAITELDCPTPLFQTWNPLRTPADGSMLADVKFDRPILTKQSRQVITALREQSASERILLTGSYLCDGIPLLDGAVQSSLRIAKLLNSSRAW